MNKKLGLKVFLSNPIEVIKSGMRVRSQNYYKKLLEKAYNFSSLKTISIIDLLGDETLEETIENYTFLSGTSLVTDLLLLKSLARKSKNCNYLEIGSWRGESLLNVSKVAKKCTSITLSASDMRKMNISEDFIKVHGIFSKNLTNVKVIEANSLEFDFNSLNEKFDLIFVDGDHSYKGVLNDTQKVFNLRSNDKSIIVWHDYGMDTEEVRFTTLKAILDGVPNEKHQNLYHVSNTMCAIYIEDLNVNSITTKFPTFPDKIFNLKVNIKKID